MAIIEHLGLDSSDFDKGLADAERKTKSFSYRIGSFVGAPFQSIGARLGTLVSAGLLAKLTKDAVSFASSLTDAAEATRTTVESYQALAYAARDAGASQEKMTAALSKVSNNAQAALQGNEEYRKSLERLQIDVAGFAALSPDRQLEALGRAYVSTGMTAQGFAAVAKLIGEEAGPKLIEVLKRLGNEGLDGVTKAAREAGQVLDELDAKKLDRLADAMEQWKTRALISIGEVVTGLNDLWMRMTGRGINSAQQTEIDARARAIEELQNEGVIARRIPGAPVGPSFNKYGMPDMEGADREAAAIEQRTQDILNAIAKKANEDRAAAEVAAAQAAAQDRVRIAGNVAEIIVKAENDRMRDSLSLGAQLDMVNAELAKQYAIAQNIEETEFNRIRAAKEIARLIGEQGTLEKKISDQREKDRKAEDDFRDRTRFSFDEILSAAGGSRNRPRPSSEAKSGARQINQLENMALQYRSWGRDEEADMFQSQADAIRQKIPGLRSSDKNFAKDSYNKLVDIDMKLKDLAENVGVATAGGGSKQGGK